MNDKHIKKALAPIIIVALVLLYYIVMGAVLIKINLPLIIKVVIILVSLSIAGVGVYVLYERIQEIRGGEEDDLGKY